MEDVSICDTNTTEESVLCTQERQNLKFWGLPESILKQYEKRGVVSMFPWQVECLCCGNVLKGGNLVYSAPTSAGKTLVAEILTIKTVLERKKKVIIILPFVSVVREKMFYFKDLLSGCAIQVAGLMGSASLPGGFKRIDIAICTIEKANSLVNRLLEEGSLHKVGAVIVDELHLLGDPFRGYLLELLLTKILYMQKIRNSIQIQVIGMSATLPNLDLLASWLSADLYTTDFRPVPLQEFLKVDCTVYDSHLKKLYSIQPAEGIQDDPDHVVQLCLETVIGGHSVLVFCATKSWCEKLATHIAHIFRTVGFSGGEMAEKIRKQLNSAAILEAMEQLQRCPVGIDKVLRGTIAFGVAFHHAGLTLDERDIIEGCFRVGTLRVIVATSTLSSGVNLPAHRVIIRSPVFHGKPLDAHTYRQMIGRAGRMGHDTAGESFLLCHKSEQQIGERLVKAKLTPIESCLGHSELTASLKRAILEVIASGVASTPEQVSQYTSCTLLAASKPSLENPVSSCVQFLEKNEFIRLQEKEEEGQIYAPTPLGLACLAASLPPDEGLQLFDELSKARQCFVLDTDLHVVYEVTPYSVSMQWGNLDWLHVLNLWEELPATMKRVGELVGVDERFMIRAMRGTLSLSNYKQIRKMSIHRRFYTALALHELVNEVPLIDVASKFGCSRGMLQSLQQSAATFAGMVTAFCRRLGWSTIELVVSQFQDRLQFGVQRELCDLMRLDNLNGQRARALFNAGITTISELAAADVNFVENILHTAVPFQSAKEIDGETTFETEQRNRLRAVWITGKHGLTEREAANMLILDARLFLQKDLGLADAKWDAEHTQSSNGPSDTNSSSSISSLSSLSSESILKNENEILPLENTKMKIKDLETLSEEECLAASPVNDSVCCSKEMKQSKKRSKKGHALQHSKKCLLSTSSKNIINTQVCTITQENKIVTSVEQIRRNKQKTDAKLVDSNASINCDSNQQIDKVPVSICQKQDVHTSMSKQNINENSVSLKITESFFKDVDMKVEKIENEFCEKAFTKSELKNENLSDQVLKNNERLQEIKKECIFNNKNEEEILKFVKASEFQRNLNVSYSPCDKVIGAADYKSPSLFGDSFTLDSQLDEVLADCHDNFHLENDKNSASVQNFTITKTMEDRGNVKPQATENENDNHGRNVPNVKDSPNIGEDHSETEPLMKCITDSKGRKGIVLQLTELPSPEILHSVNFEDINFESLTINSVQVCHNSCEVASDSLHFESAASSPAKKRKHQGEKTNTIQNIKRQKTTKKNNTLHMTLSNKENGLNNIKVCSISPHNIKANSVLKGIQLSGNSKLGSRTDDNTIDFDAEKNTNLEQNNETLSDEEHDVITDSFLEKAFDTYLNMSLQTIAETSSQDCDDNVDLPAKVDRNSDPEEVFNLSDKRILEEAFISSWDLEQDSQILNSSNLREEQYMHTNSSEIAKQERTISSSEKKKKEHTANNRRRSPRLIAAANGFHRSSLESRVRNANSTPVWDNRKQNDLLLEGCIQHESTPKIKANKVLSFDSDNSLVEKDDLIISSQETTSAKDSGWKGNLPRRKKCKSKKATTRSSSRPTGGKENVAPESSSNNNAEDNVDCVAISIIDVCKDKQVWASFQTEVQQAGTEVAMAVACERYKPQRKSSGGIGAKIMRKPGHKKDKACPSESILCHGSLCLVGMAFCFGGKDVYYVDLKEGESISISERLEFLCTVMSLGWELRTFDLKEQIKALSRCCNMNVKLSTGHDPKIADWLLEPDGKEKTLHAMALKYCTNELCKFFNLIGSSLSIGSAALDLSSDTSGRLRSCVEAVLVWEIVEAQQTLLDELDLKTTYSELEMPTLICLINMELVGIGFDRKEAERLQSMLEQQMVSLENEAYRLAGHTFSLTSSADIAKVLYRELKLAAGRSNGKQRCPSTSKEALMRIKAEHPLPGLILQWRKLNAMMAKTVFPLLRAVQNDCRIFGCSVMHTATGRISMHEPNLQNIPRDFEVVVDSDLKGATDISMRTAFIPQPGKVFISADYCQLELRILAHLAKDDKLCCILNSGEDVFCNIASSWKKIPAREVTQHQRQWAKQICYGMIYGIGARALSEQLDVEEEEAAVYMDTFKNTYPGVKGFLIDAVSRCRKEGYIETLMGRRRYLPSICASHAAARAHAERQAINSTVQGSAADVVKRGMVLVEKHLLEAQLASPLACLVLHLHDELLYEVPQEKSLEIARLIKGALESAVTLSVKLPVKVKVGNSWGSLREITL